MKISGIKKIEAEKIFKLVEDFKQYLIFNKIEKFSYDNFVEFVNRPENQSKYLIVAYK